MSNEVVEFILFFVKKRIEEDNVTPGVIEVIENTINNSQGKTPERYELLKIWRQLAA